MGFFEIVFLSLLALILIGPKDLPSLIKAFVSLLNELKRVTSEIAKPLNVLKEKKIQIPLEPLEEEESKAKEKEKEKSPDSETKQISYESSQTRRKKTETH